MPMDEKRNLPNGSTGPDGTGRSDGSVPDQSSAWSPSPGNPTPEAQDASSQYQSAQGWGDPGRSWGRQDTSGQQGGRQDPAGQQGAQWGAGRPGPTYGQPGASQPSSQTWGSTPQQSYAAGYPGGPQNPQPQGYQQPYQVQTTEKPRGKGLRAGAVALVAVLAAGVGGVSGWAVNAAGGGDSASPGSQTTVTKVVQGNKSAPDWTATASAVSDSVVSISVSSGQGTAAGSGVILDTKGNIVTNNHVVSAAGSGGQIKVSMGDKTYTASVVGTDSSSDLAVIRLTNPPSGLKPISFADSDKLSVGAPVMAIGNPLGLSGSVTTGIISALNRPVSTSSDESQTSGSSSDVVVTNAIQTSAPINPGNSGGALVNADGQLIGINSSIASLSSGSSSSQSGSIGIGFAIPANQVENITSQLISTGKAKHAFLGLTTEDATATVDGVELSGAGVHSIQSGAPAAKAGVKEGDVIIKMDNTTVTSGEGLVGLVRSKKVGQKVTLTLVRDGSEQKVTATLAAAAQ